MQRLLNGLTRVPELNLMFFAFLLNYVWETFQMPLYDSTPPSAPYGRVINMCAGASVADAVLMLIAFWAAAAFARSRHWYRESKPLHLAVFVVVGLILTIVIEIIFTTSGKGWSYGPNMPVIFGVGLSPFLQWVFPPLLTVWLLRRQLGVGNAQTV